MRKHYTSQQKTQIVLEILKEEKTVAQIASANGVHPNQLYRWKAQVLEGLPGLFTNENKAAQEKQAVQDQQIQDLYAEIGHLTTQLSWLKKNLGSTRTRDERLEMLEPGCPDLSFQTQTELLGINRTSLYYQPVTPSALEIATKRRIDEIYTAHPYYGSRRITVILQKELPISRPTVQRHMREMGIAGICPGPNLSKRNLAHQIYPYLLRHRVVMRVNEVWGIDITYIRLHAGWMYLVAVLDWFSRYVISWALDQSLEETFVLQAVDQALNVAIPEIWNRDQGSHFTSPQYLNRLLAAEVQISMDGKGRALDNIFTERLWRTIKYEEVYLREYASPREARQGIGQYLSFYNQERPHQSLAYRTPAEVYYPTAQS